MQRKSKNSKRIEGGGACLTKHRPCVKKEEQQNPSPSPSPNPSPSASANPTATEIEIKTIDEFERIKRMLENFQKLRGHPNLEREEALEAMITRIENIIEKHKDKFVKEQEQSLGGSTNRPKDIKKTDSKILIEGKERVVYKGAHGKQYVKMQGACVAVLDLRKKETGSKSKNK